MIYFPETIDTISTMSLRVFTLSSWGYARRLTLCMLAFWSHEGVVFLDFLPSSHFVTSFLFPWLGSTDTLCPRLGDPVPLSPRWRPYLQGPRTLPYRDPEHLQCHYPNEKKPNFVYFLCMWSGRYIKLNLCLHAGLYGRGWHVCGLCSICFQSNSRIIFGAPFPSTRWFSNSSVQSPALPPSASI